MEEELRREIKTRESLQEQWKMERNKWIEEIEKLEKLREAESKVYRACLQEKATKMQEEFEREKRLLEMEREKDRAQLLEKMEKLEASMALEREQRQRERENIMLEVENERQKRAEIEKEKEKIATAWREHVDVWSKQFLENESTMETMREEREEMDRRVLQLEMEKKKLETLRKTEEEQHELKGKMQKGDSEDLKKEGKSDYCIDDHCRLLSTKQNKINHNYFWFIFIRIKQNKHQLMIEPIN